MVKEIFFYTLTRRPKNDATGTLRSLKLMSKKSLDSEKHFKHIFRGRVKSQKIEFENKHN